MKLNKNPAAGCPARSGFTFIELMIVLVVITILIGFIIPNYTGVIDEKNISKAEGEVELYKIALDNYYRKLIRIFT